MRDPKVTVLMPVFNGERYLKEAMESILRQTFSDHEFLIVDDESKDQSVNIIKSFMDERIRLVINERKLGLSASLNKGIKLSKGEYIARMDSDDISHPNRLAEQIAFMEKHPDVGICGTWIESIGDIEGASWQPPVNHRRICVEMLFFCCLAHPTVMMRKSVLLKHSLLYDEKMPHVEDYELWARALNSTKLSNIPKVLLKLRKHGHAKSLNSEQESFTDRVRRQMLSRLLPGFSDEDYALHKSFAEPNPRPSKEFLGQAHSWFSRLISANERRGICDSQALKWVLAHKWFYAARKLPAFELLSWKDFWRLSFESFACLSPFQKAASVYYLLKILTRSSRSI
jgi:glycosyltransferase involved in cell wall biosynthesis